MRNGLPERIPVFVHAEDPVLRAGVESQLRFRPEIEVVGAEASERAAVAVVVAETPDANVVQTVRHLRRTIGTRIVLLAAAIDDRALIQTIEAGVTGILHRSEATAERLAAAVQVAQSGDGSLPPDLLGRLLGQVGNLQQSLLSPRALALCGLTHREIDVLRLVADGHSIREIAEKLSYSERTIKTAIHDLITRLHLRNRAHAVAYAVRAGLI
jgi:DNA-binding NarL/FixJ family response regulator